MFGLKEGDGVNLRRHCRLILCVKAALTTDSLSQAPVGSGHPRRPRGSQSGAGEMARRKFSRTGERTFLKTFVAPFRPPPTDCPWVSEDGERQEKEIAMRVNDN